jgi:hypothetical protein
MVVKRAVLWLFAAGAAVAVGYAGRKFGSENVTLRFYCSAIKSGR